jgi:hypothetical protein
MGVAKRSFLYTACCGVAFILPWPVIAQDMRAADPGTSPPVATAVAIVGRTEPVGALTEVTSVQELPDSPGTQWAKSQEATSHDANSNSDAQATDTKTQDKPQRPVGTAAAEAPKVTGITAAEPAGVAIAPAKQHRVRTIVLKVGAIVGAGAALGTVIALSAGTSSKPPGAH